VDGDGQSLMRDQRVWSVMECAEIFCRSITELKQQLASSTNNSTAVLVWDKVGDTFSLFVSDVLIVVISANYTVLNER